jgi:hypothetical protein
MAAHDNLNYQLKMFMGAREFQDTPSMSVDTEAVKGEPGWEAMWSRKLMQAQEPADTATTSVVGTHAAGLYDSMKKRGYDSGQHKMFDEAPTLSFDESGEFLQGQGHHRIVTGAAIERESRIPLAPGVHGPPRPPRDVWMPVNYVGPRPKAPTAQQLDLDIM